MVHPQEGISFPGIHRACIKDVLAHLRNDSEHGKVQSWNEMKISSKTKLLTLLPQLEKLSRPGITNPPYLFLSSAILQL